MSNDQGHDPQTFNQDGWLAWCTAGRELFRGTGATLKAAKRLAAGVVALDAMRRMGSISGAARALRTARKSVRDALRAVGAYRRP